MKAEQLRVTVRPFAGLREQSGVTQTTIALAAPATVRDAWATFWATVTPAEPLPGIEAVALAVNREYVRADAAIRDGDELSLIPPVSGGAGAPKPIADADLHAAVSAEPLDQGALHARVARRSAGAIVVFSGTPRDVPQLDYEAHEQMAVERIRAILAEVGASYGACALAAEHRVGPVPWPESAVVVAVSAPHRAEAFAAARAALDRIKAESPIWKQEVDGDERRRVPGSLPTSAPAVAATIAQPGPVAPAPPEPGERSPGGLLPHLRPDGGATMVDVGGKAVTERRAVAAAMLTMAPETAELIRRGDLPKGDVLGVARIAGIIAAKRVPDLVPLAHPLPLTKVDVRAEVVPVVGQVRIEAEARTVGTTGVEIEAMTAALVAAINVYDMVKGVERGIVVGPVTLIAKHGGRADFAGPPPWAIDRHPAPGEPEHGPAVAPAVGANVAATPGPIGHGPTLESPPRVGIVTVSNSRAREGGNDAGSLALRELATALGGEVVAAEHVVDDEQAIAAVLRRLADETGCDVVLTAGGTGCTVDDVTPEATQSVTDRPVAGIAEALRLAARDHTAAWPLSRGVAAIRERTLIVNLPGSPSAATEAQPVLAPILPHVVALLRR